MLPQIIKIIPLVILSVSQLGYSQILEVEFDTTPPSGVFRNDDASQTEITSWATDANILDGSSGGTIHVENTGTSFDGLDIFFSASASTNWISTGLGDAGSGINGVGEFVSLAFNRNVTFTELDLADFTETDATSLTINSGGSSSSLMNVVASDTTVGRIPLSLELQMGDSLNINWDNPGTSNSFYIQGFTLTAVPEPSTIFLIGLGLAILTILRIRRKSHETC